MDRKAWWVTVHGFRRAGHDWACTQTHTSCLYTPLGHLDKHSEKHVYEFVFLANILHLVFICEVICSKKETPPVCVDPRVKPSRMLESRCSQVALFLCHTGNSPYSNVFIQCFYKNVFLRFSVFSRKCHKFLKNQLKTQFNHWYLSAFISLSHMPVIFMRC